jgi:hypothetical protein
MHGEHELLERTYVNNKILYMAPVSCTQRAIFRVTENGYKWDVEELAIRSRFHDMQSSLA